MKTFHHAAGMLVLLCFVLLFCLTFADPTDALVAVLGLVSAYGLGLLDGSP